MYGFILVPTFITINNASWLPPSLSPLSLSLFLSFFLSLSLSLSLSLFLYLFPSPHIYLSHTHFFSPPPSSLSLSLPQFIPLKFYQFCSTSFDYFIIGSKIREYLLRWII